MKTTTFTSIGAFIDCVFPTWEHGVVLELGANNGKDTLRMASQLTPPYHYFCFEPDRRNFPPLMEVAKSLGPQVEVYPRAVCDYSGVATFNFSSGRRPVDPDTSVHLDSGSLMEPSGIQWRYPWMKFFSGSVRTITIDDFCKYKHLERINFLWMDIQGAEMLALQGARRMLPRTQFVYAECYRHNDLYRGQPGFDDFAAFFGESWRVLLRTETDVLFENTHYEAQ